MFPLLTKTVRVIKTTGRPVTCTPSWYHACDTVLMCMRSFHTTVLMCVRSFQESSTMAWLKSCMGWLTLARCGRSSNVQTRCHHAQMSAWQGSSVPCRLLHTGHRCCRQAASQVSHTATDGGATTSAIHCWMPSICCARPHGLGLTTSTHSRTVSPLDRAWKPGYSPDTSVFCTLETFVIIQQRTTI